MKTIVSLISGLVILISAVVVLPTTLTSGLQYCEKDSSCSIQFWGAHEHDGVWHMAVATMLMNEKGQVMPTLSGVALTGYNILLDWLLAIASSISGFMIVDWYFRIIPLIWFIGFILMIYKLQKAYLLKPYFAPIAIVFGMLGSSFSYLLTLAKNSSLIGSSSLLSMQSALTLFNPQLGLSLLCILGYLILISKKKNGAVDYLQIGLLLALALGLKVYTGIVMSFMIFGWVASQLTKEKKEVGKYLIRILFLSLPPVIVLAFFYYPGNGNFPFFWKPFAPVTPLVEDQSLLYIPQLANRLYSEKGIALFIIQLIITILFVIMNFGTRIVGMLYLFFSKRMISRLEHQLVIGAVVGFLASILLIQRGVWWNTVQFLHVSLFFGGMLAALGITTLFEKNTKLSWVMGVFVILLTIFPNIDVMRTYLRYPGSSKITSQEYEALKVLEKLPEGVVYTAPFVRTELPQSNPPLLSEAHDTAYITAYTGKQVYLADQIQLELLSLPYADRLSMMQRHDCRILNDVTYLYERKSEPYVNKFSACDNQSFRTIFENEEVKIVIVEE